MLHNYCRACGLTRRSWLCASGAAALYFAAAQTAPPFQTPECTSNACINRLSCAPKRRSSSLLCAPDEISVQPVAVACFPGGKLSCNLCPASLEVFYRYVTIPDRAKQILQLFKS